MDTFRETGAADVRGEGAGFVVLESLDAARARGARILGEIVGEAWRALAVRPHGVGRATRSPAIAAALAGAGAEAGEIGLVYTSANGDGPREEWERALLDRALAPHRPPQRSLSLPAGRHSASGGALGGDRRDGGRRSARAGPRGGARRQSDRDRRRGLASSRGMTVLIVVPVFNEAETVGSVVDAARAYGPVLVVDDGSRDGSAEIAARAGAEVIRHPQRRGKGAAIRTGIAAARERGATGGGDARR